MEDRAAARHARRADSEDPQLGTDARIRHGPLDRAVERRRSTHRGRLAVSSAVSHRAEGLDRLVLGSLGQSAPSQVLPADHRRAAPTPQQRRRVDHVRARGRACARAPSSSPHHERHSILAALPQDLHPTAHSPRGGAPDLHPTAHSPRGRVSDLHPTAHSPRGGAPVLGSRPGCGRRRRIRLSRADAHQQAVAQGRSPRRGPRRGTARLRRFRTGQAGSARRWRAGPGARGPADRNGGSAGSRTCATPSASCVRVPC